MAIRGAVRWMPDSRSNAQQSYLEGFDTGTTPPSGNVVMIAQVVAYDDTQVTGANYREGDPSTERLLTIIDQVVVRKSIAGMYNLTQAEVDAGWEAERQAIAARYLPHGAALVKMIRGARKAPPLLL
jgi:hypothetical protein